jgi:hypothetical protein
MARIIKYEYINRYFSCKDLPEYSIAKFLNDMGEEGWELVQIIERPFINDPFNIANRTFYFKRVKL